MSTATHEMRGAIAYKRQPLAEEASAWDGPAQVKAAEVSDLRAMAAWVDPDRDDTKVGYKLPHHRASDHYTVWRGVAAAMSALLGGRGGVDIPDGDRRAVYNHLAKHYADFDREPPEFRELELRGAGLAELLNEIVDKAIDDGLAFGDVKASRKTIAEAVASEADISTNAVNQVMRGAISCPRLATLEAFAKVLKVSVGRLVSAAEDDGCTYDRDMGAAADTELRADVREREQAEVRRLVVPLDGAEVREEDGKLRFRGHAAVFDRWSEDLGGFREQIKRGSFRRLLKGDPDVRFLFNHDPSLVLARTSSGTMTLREDGTGLLVDAELAPTQLGRDLAVLVRRGDVDAMSFGFRVGSDEWDWPEDEAELAERTITEFSELHDVGAVTFPAYADTDAEMRSFRAPDGRLLAALEPGELRELAWHIHRGEVEASQAQRAAIDRALERHSTVSPWAAERALRATCSEPELQAAVPGMTATVELKPTPQGGTAWRAAARRRRLRLRELTTGG